MRKSHLYPFLSVCLGLIILCFGGCFTTKGNTGCMTIYKVPGLEAEWIRNGDPIQFENEWWYPQDRVDILIDSEVYLLGEYQGVQFFIDRTDVRPYQRLYTKFEKNKFRVFEKEKK